MLAAKKYRIMDSKDRTLLYKDEITLFNFYYEGLTLYIFTVIIEEIESIQKEMDSLYK